MRHAAHAMFALEHPGKMPSYIQESSNPSISVEGTSLCQDVTFSPCYSSACRKARAREVELGGWVQVARLCYSPYCRANPPPPVKRSYWKHPKIRALRARVRMVLALDVFKDLVIFLLFNCTQLKYLFFQGESFLVFCPKGSFRLFFKSIVRR